MSKDDDYAGKRIMELEVEGRGWRGESNGG